MVCCQNRVLNEIALAVGKCGFAKLLRQPEILNVMQNKKTVYGSLKLKMARQRLIAQIACSTGLTV